MAAPVTAWLFSRDGVAKSPCKCGSLPGIYTNKCSYGVKMPRLGTTDGKKAVIPVPPIKEQKRIVMAIELTFDQLASIAENLA